MIGALEKIAKSDLVQLSDGWTTLVSEEFSKKLIEKYVPTERDEVTFEWRE